MMWIIFGVLTIVFLIIVSAFFSSSEMAFVSINKAVIIDKARKGDKKAKILEELLKNPDNVISAIVIGNNLVNIFASILAGIITTTIFGNIGIGIATVVMMFLILIFSEATPKAFGIKNENLALKVARSLSIITKLFHPMVVLLNSISSGLISLVGGKKRRTVVTEHEIMAMMRLGEEEGTIEKDEREMVNDVFEFDETHAYEIYTPKDKVEFIRENEAIENLIQKSIKTGFSRFPAYRKDLNDIVGMAHVKDSLIIEDTSLHVKYIMRKILKIDSSMKADDVLREMKRNKTHLALLQDQEGKTLGLISMEDLIEEIFGEISDEHDMKV
ncbi:MAG: HlyC/CorC family transporter [Thermoplasmatales archaeon]|nr:MAG: HlyC/CorC family transporter [Thermoplasmatales archaeon]